MQYLINNDLKHNRHEPSRIGGAKRRGLASDRATLLLSRETRRGQTFVVTNDGQIDGS
jgi:hypothetical protein